VVVDVVGVVDMVRPPAKADTDVFVDSMNNADTVIIIDDDDGGKVIVTIFSV